MKTKTIRTVALLLLLLDTFETAGQQPHSKLSSKPESAPASVLKMRRLLSLPQEHAPLAPEILHKSEDGEVVIEDVRFRAERAVWVPASVVKPRNSPQRLPAIICLPGTNGTRQHLTDSQLQLSQFPRTGWA